MRKIFDITFLCVCLFLGDIAAGSWVHCAQLPADIYQNAGLKLKNREVIKVQQYLFTRVNLKTKSKSFTSLDGSKASLYAQQNFAMYLHGQIHWTDDLSSTEKRMIEALYRQATSVSVVLKGLTLIHSFYHNGLQSYIYAVNAPMKIPRKINQREVIKKIQRAATANNIPLDHITYLELALRWPELFNPKIGIKRLGKSCGKNFVFFLLGMDLPNAKALTGISKVNFTQLAELDKYQIAVLIDERPYDTTLALAFTRMLLQSHHEELAKMTIRNG